MSKAKRKAQQLKRAAFVATIRPSERMHWVGERGPELLFPPGSCTIVPPPEDSK